MELDEFIFELENELSELYFVERWEIERKATTARIKIYLQPKGLLNIYYNQVLRIQSFALIMDNNRVWGLDRDNKFGWHEHPVDNPETHESTKEHSIAEIIERLKNVWYTIND